MLNLRITGTDIAKYLKQIRTTLRSRGVVLSFFIAFSLWLYVSLNNYYSIYINVPLNIKINEDQAIETKYQPFISVEIKGKGWDLFNIQIFKQSQSCFIDLSKTDIKNQQIVVPYSRLVQGLRSLEQFEVRNINPENLTLSMSLVDKSIKPVVPDIEIQPRYGFTLIGNVVLIPPELEAKGSKKTLDSINNFTTEHLIIEDAYTDISGKIKVANMFSSDVLKIIPSSVNYSAKIQQTCNIKFEQIPIKVIGGNLNASNIIEPSYLTVYLVSGVDEISKISPSDINISVDYNQVLNDTTGIIVPNISLPPNIKLLKTEPPFLYHYNNKAGLLN